MYSIVIIKKNFEPTIIPETSNNKNSNITSQDQNNISSFSPSTSSFVSPADNVNVHSNDSINQQETTIEGQNSSSSTLHNNNTNVHDNTDTNTPRENINTNTSSDNNNSNWQPFKSSDLSQDHWVLLDMKLIGWSYMDFQMMVSAKSTYLQNMKQIIEKKHGKIGFLRICLDEFKSSNEIVLFNSSDDSVSTQENNFKGSKNVMRPIQMKTLLDIGIVGAPSKNEAPTKTIYYDFRPYAEEVSLFHDMTKKTLNHEKHIGLTATDALSADEEESTRTLDDCNIPTSRPDPVLLSWMDH